MLSARLPITFRLSPEKDEDALTAASATRGKALSPEIGCQLTKINLQI